MKIKQIYEWDESAIIEFVSGVNIAFSQRKDIRNQLMSFRDITEEEIKNEIEEGSQVYVCEKDELIVGGLCCKYDIENKAELCKIYHVWIHPHFQGRGIAQKLLSEIEKVAKSKNCVLMRLNVANTYKPALKLYEKMGYVPLKIYANEPGTYYFIRMVKKIGTYKYFSVKRYQILLSSMVKFVLLYKKDSSPTVLNRLIYGSGK